MSYGRNDVLLNAAVRMLSGRIPPRDRDGADDLQAAMAELHDSTQRAKQLLDELHEDQRIKRDRERWARAHARG